MILHGFAADGPDAVVKAIGAGCDVSMQSGLYVKHLPTLVREGRVSMATVDTAVRPGAGGQTGDGVVREPLSLAGSGARAT